tara:strand:+ start:3190 stop:3501 length:312 start_codon:yes stop_codon:yes gene_type:complete
MNQENLLDKPIWQMTGEQFISLLKNNTESESGEISSQKSSKNNQKKTYVYGIRGIANLINRSISTANRIKKSGIIDDAIIQHGRTIMVDSEKALQLLKENSEI